MSQRNCRDAAPKPPGGHRAAPGSAGTREPRFWTKSERFQLLTEHKDLLAEHFDSGSGTDAAWKLLETATGRRPAQCGRDNKRPENQSSERSRLKEGTFDQLTSGISEPDPDHDV